MSYDRSDFRVTISVVIPTYNRANTLIRAIDSVRAQEYPASEIIVVDDGSTDATQELLQQYGQKVRFFLQQNSGVSGARNRGVDEASQEWIAFLDSDDYWTPGHLSVLASAIEATNGEAALYFCDTRLYQQGQQISYWELSDFRLDTSFRLVRDASAWALMRVQPMLLQSAAIRKASYMEVGGLPRGLRTREDTLLFYKLCLRYPACAVAGGVTVMTSDGAKRLTQESGSTTLIFMEATLAVHKEMYEFVSIFRPEYRKIFRDNISRSYYSMSRHYYRHRKLLRTAMNLADSVCTSPHAFARSFGGSIRKRLGI